MKSVLLLNILLSTDALLNHPKTINVSRNRLNRFHLMNSQDTPKTTLDFEYLRSIDTRLDTLNSQGSSYLKSFYDYDVNSFVIDPRIRGRYYYCNDYSDYCNDYNDYHDTYNNYNNTHHYHYNHHLNHHLHYSNETISNVNLSNN